MGDIPKIAMFIGKMIKHGVLAYIILRQTRVGTPSNTSQIFPNKCLMVFYSSFHLDKWLNTHLRTMEYGGCFRFGLPNRQFIVGWMGGLYCDPKLESHRHSWSDVA
jgi:hypothetical protein